MLYRDSTAVYCTVNDADGEDAARKDGWGDLADVVASETITLESDQPSEDDNANRGSRSARK